jgi:lipoyl(octanoyl) transferase
LNIKNFNVAKSDLRILDLGLIEYQEAWEIQTHIHQSLIAQKKETTKNEDGFKQNHTLIICQHPHVFTLGKSGSEDHLLVDTQNLGQINASFHKINRGGDITYHGPGQLVAYPILDLDQIFADVHKYVRSLEEVIIRTCKDFNLETGRIQDYTGVWVDTEGIKPRKICAIGVHLSRWVSLHGLAFNVAPDLKYFDYILPCGIEPLKKSVTSLEKELGKDVDFEQVKQIFISHFVNVFKLNVINGHE